MVEDPNVFLLPSPSHPGLFEDLDGEHIVVVIHKDNEVADFNGVRAGEPPPDLEGKAST
jgi:hypothetical protein